MKNENLPPLRRDQISVCICTYKRPDLLADLLRELGNQATHDLFDFSIVVVDNDHDGSAESAVASIRPHSSLKIEYAVEPVQNIAMARNKSIRQSNGNFIAFIDDDEIPENTWLYCLYETLRNSNADGVLGPVLPRYKTKPPSWVIRGKFYERPTYRTGLILDWRKGRTGNILLKKEIFGTAGDVFDPKFGSGAEDQDFIRRMIGKGYVFIWCNEARAYEYVPPIRWKRMFLIKRALLRGEVSLNHPEIVIPSTIKSLIAIPVYTMALPLLLILGHHIFMQYLVKDFDHIGKILSLLGLNLIKQKYVIE